MKRITDHIRTRILDRAGIPSAYEDAPRHSLKSPEEILDEEMDWAFLYCMASSILMGYFRYGPTTENRINCLKEAKRRLFRYEKTGNQEFLVDAANYLMREKMHPSIDNVHYKSTDDGIHSR